MDVLAARHRLGEQTWTFSSKVSPAAQRLERRGLAWWKYGITEKSIVVGLTDEGKKLWLSPTFDTEVSKANGDHLLLSPEEASAVEDALSYYTTAARDNFGAGYYGEEDMEVLTQHRMAQTTMDRVTDYLEARDRERKPIEGVRVGLRVNLPPDPEPHREMNPMLRTTCFNPHPHAPHAWDVEDRSRLRYHCRGLYQEHGIGASEKTMYSNGTLGFWTVSCSADGCAYRAKADSLRTAEKRVLQHVAGKNRLREDK